MIIIALQVWLPLNGNLTNNGVGNLTISCTATVDNAGKIGKCYVCASGNHISFTNPITTSTTDFAISCWIYVTEYTSGYSSVFSSRTATSGKGLALWVQSGSIRFDDGENWTVSNTFTLNTWTHICVTYSKTNGKSIYVNGNLVGSKATVGALANLRSELFIGYDHYGYYLGGKINDLRVWEGSAPSPKEIELIARGLVLHYPLSLPMPNLAKGSNTADISTNVFIFSEATGGSTRTIEYDGGIPCAKITRNSTTHSSWSYLHYDKWDRAAIKPSTTYTLSFDIIGSGSGSIGFSGFLNGNGTNSISASVEGIQNTFNADRWSHLVFRTTTIADFTDKGTGQTIYMTCSYLHNTNVWIMMKNMKLEEGVNDTPWIPHTSDTGYSTMGLGSTTEYDVSGYNYHGTKVGTLTYNSDTPRYSACTVFNGADATINCGNDFHVQGAKNMSMSCWAYCKDWAATTDNKYLLSSQQTGGLILGYLNGTTVRARWHVYTASDLSASGYKQADYETALTSGWHHFCGTCDESQIKLYLDGVLVKTTSVTNYGIHFHNSASMFIGAESTGSSYSDLFTGKISDVRIYYTTLTADQVVDLYSTAISISNSGALMGYELVEQ